MREEAGIFFNAIASRTHDFYRRYRKGEAYARLTKEAVLAAYDESLARGAPGRRKLSVRVASRRHARQAGKGKKELEEKEEQAGGGEGSGNGGDGGGGGATAVVLRSLEDIRAFKARTPIYD